ncbi:hypothetical protein LTR78_007753 [Recurvomyces mirabilis]|uniref:Glycosyltransferase family 25 protein n=1 Tax=Recurvomyces mirabilis TaxID=574656 RepID=A0AAE0TRF0_9PEZI|nr:hypothetical protein LTR78_007753 [Recurvomyces mirabilis]KAK5151641.1 hypothetical protein LTS14_009128 [Recurvomyces mirabilis]
MNQMLSYLRPYHSSLGIGPNVPSKAIRFRVGCVLLLIALLSTWFILTPARVRHSLIHTSQIPSNILGVTRSTPRESATNATLGFQRILALSGGPSWRTRGLKAAAAYTGLEIDIPERPNNSPELVDAFRQIGNGKKPALGAARAWLSHLDMLKYVIQSGLHTALILEDDVDWDLALKDQMLLVSDAVRNFTRADASEPSPYGRNWDILWLGHCGEYTVADTERFEYEDSTVLSHANYTGWAAPYITNMGEGHRLVQHGVNPICTFAYAVTRQGAQRALEWAEKGESEAFDVKLMEACRPKILNVVTVQPELMHHYTPPHDAGYWSEVNAGDGKGTDAGESAYESRMGGTENIIHSARCKALFDRTCLKPFWEQY